MKTKVLLRAAGGLAVICLLILLARSRSYIVVSSRAEITDSLSTNEVMRTTVAIREITEDAETEKSNEGSFIAVSADYRRHLGFVEYVDSMKGLGGRFVLFDPVRQKILAEVDPVSGEFSNVSPTALGNMSPRSREVQNEIAVSRTLRKASQKFGFGQYKILLLLPQSVDARMQASLYSLFNKHGISPSRIVSASGYYQKDAGLTLHITEVQKSDGGKLRVQAALKL